MLHIAILTRQIGHYHDARYRGASAKFDRTTIISSANQGGFAEFLAKNTGEYDIVRLFDNQKSYLAAVSDGALAGALHKALSTTSPDVVAVSGWTTPESIEAIRWARDRRIPLIVMSESQLHDAPRSLIRETVKSRIVSLCDAALVGGPSHARYAEKLGIPQGRTFLGYNAVENAHFDRGATKARQNADASRREHNLPERYILASARFIEKKNLPTLVQAYADAVSQTENAPDLVILGDGDVKDDIIEAAQLLGVRDRVSLPGYRGYDVLPTYYGLAEGFAHVSTVEQWGLVVNEAMASAVPVVVSRPCGVAQTVLTHRENGLVVEPNRAEIAAALKLLFEMPKAERTALGKRGHATISEWGPERFGEGLRAAAECAIASRRRGRVAPWDLAILNMMSRQVTERVA